MKTNSVFFLFFFFLTLSLTAQNASFPTGDAAPEWCITVSQYNGTEAEVFVKTWRTSEILDTCGVFWSNIIN